ncbi:sulfotransferase [Arenimonas daejeonensis]|uniref:sulfotransferase n=1 Tax=Arenimonas daejeonensis TaxID=370777 RepID=UPI0011BF214D|nr:sulfotransferase [Arenimonas daejeonensis]
MTTPPDWKQWVRDYFRDPVSAWGDIRERQVVKLESVISIALKRHGLSRDSFVESLIAAVQQRAPDQTLPVYLVNLGGCGSHWVSRMMAQSAGLMDAGEVYLPQRQYAELRTQDREQAARMMDATELAHGLLYGLDPADFASARMVNSAHGCEKISFYRWLRPDAKVIHLVRDPRDRTMSVSFRKAEYRAYEATGLDDFEYMLSKARRSQSYWDRYSGLRHKADVQVSYEDFRKRGPDTLRNMLAAIGLEISTEVAADVSHRNSPEFLRSTEGMSAERGNLDQGGVAKSWRDMEPNYRRSMHAVMARAISGQGYALCDCFPQSPAPTAAAPPGLPQVLAKLPDEVVSRYDVKSAAEDGWHPLKDRGELEPGDRVRLVLRNGDMALPGGDALRPWITDLCAAGLAKFGDEPLALLGRLERVVNLDLACSGVRCAPSATQLPSLARTNTSGLPEALGVPGEIRDFQ